MVMPKVDLWSNIDIGSNDACWPWLGRLDENGYGRLGKRSRMVHRVVYEERVGPISDGMELDHTCHTLDESCAGGVTCLHRRCANPAHLEPVTHKQNGLRGRSFSAVNAVKTHCPQGHPYDDVNTYVWRGAPGSSRQCRACKRKAA